MKKNKLFFFLLCFANVVCFAQAPIDICESNIPKGWISNNSKLSISEAHYKQGLQYGLYLIENKNDSGLIVKIVELDWHYGAELQKKAEGIIFAKEPPPRISENPAAYDCTYCHQKGICHNGEVPEKNCRSCRNAMPTNDATWTCSIYGVIPPDFIRTGCPDNWLPI